MTSDAISPATSLPGSSYTHEQRLEAATYYAMSGSMAEVSRRTGISESTLSGWRHSDWWPQLVEEVRSQKNVEIDAGFTRVIEKAISAVEDRLDNGDVVIVKGEELRVPVKARDAAIVAGIAFDKREQLRNPQTRPSEEDEWERLDRLADRLVTLQRTVRQRVLEGEATLIENALQSAPQSTPHYSVPEGFTRLSESES